MFIIDQIIKLVISIFCQKSTHRNTIASSKINRNTINENQRIFHKINSYLLIGFDKIRNIVFHSTSLKSN
ncbi:MAG: hypothetical protein LBC61_06910 [Candidatus Peribacteria bacterium]|nr:hypothetical protein [Candidatus Peribacteria bacterium]